MSAAHRGAFASSGPLLAIAAASRLVESASCTVRVSKPSRRPGERGSSSPAGTARISAEGYCAC